MPCNCPSCRGDGPDDPPEPPCVDCMAWDDEKNECSVFPNKLPFPGATFKEPRYDMCPKCDPNILDSARIHGYLTEILAKDIARVYNQNIGHDEPRAIAIKTGERWAVVIGEMETAPDSCDIVERTIQ